MKQWKIGDSCLFVMHTDQGQKIKEGTVQALQKMYCTLSYIDDKGKEQEKRVKISSIYDRMEEVQSALSHATKTTGSTKVFPIWNPEDVKKIADIFTEKNQYHWRLAFMLSLLTGRRIGDTLKLRWCDLYEANGRKKKHLIIKKKKTGKESYALIPDAAWIEIEAYISCADATPSENYYQNQVFPGTSNRKDAAYRVALKKAADLAGLDYNIGPHSTRKTFGYYAVQLNPDDPSVIYYLQDFLGHSDQETTMRYIGLRQEGTDKLSEDVGGLITRALNGEEVNFESSMFYTIKSKDFRELLTKAYQAGRQSSGNAEDILSDMQKLLDEADQLNKFHIKH